MVVQFACCGQRCGILIPLAVNGAFGGPEGMSNIPFNLENSTTCGIRVKDVLNGNLEGLSGRDDYVQLNPNAESIRLRIDVSNLPPSDPLTKLTRVGSCLATNPL
jgi:hypothetical protein